MEGLGTRHLPLALALGCLLVEPGATAPARTQDGALAAAARTHAAVVQDLRRERLLRSYVEADDESRARAERALERLHSPGAGLTSPPSVRAVDRAARALAEPGSGGEEWIRELADSIDLRVVPGHFEARTERRTPVSVFVEPLHAVTGVRDVVVSLSWIAEDGTERSARREPVAAAAFKPPGFEMFVSAPTGAPGTWRLVCDLEYGEERARGIPVEVRGLPDLGRRMEILRQRPPPEPGTPAALYVRSLGLEAQRGLRSLVGPDAAELLARIEMPARTPEGPEPFELAFRDEEGTEHWVWSVGSGAAAGVPTHTVVLLAPAYEMPEAALLRAEWREYARAHRARVLSTRLPIVPGGAEGVAALLDRLRASAPNTPTVVVARGDTVGALLIGLIGRARPPFDSAVFSTVVQDGPPPSILPGVPRLIVAPGGHADLAAARAARGSEDAFAWVAGADIPLLNEPRLPDLVARWFEAELAPASPR